MLFWPEAHALYTGLIPLDISTARIGQVQGQQALRFGWHHPATAEANWGEGRHHTRRPSPFFAQDASATSAALGGPAEPAYGA
jgi:hypothetical protein